MLLIFKFNLFEEFGEENLEPNCKLQQLIIYFPKCLRERIFKKLELNCFVLALKAQVELKEQAPTVDWMLFLKFKLYAPIICHFMDQIIFTIQFKSL